MSNSSARTKGDSAVAWIKPGQRDCFKLLFSPSGDHLLSVNSLGTQVWSRQSGAIVRMIHNRLGYGSNPYVFSLSGREVFYADSARIICWSIERDSMLFTFLGHHNVVKNLSLSTDGTSLLSAGDDSLVIDWDVGQDPGLHKIYHNKKQAWRASFAANGKYIAISEMYSTNIVDRESGKTLHRFNGYINSIPSYGRVIAIPEGQKSGWAVTPGIGLYDIEGKKITSLKFPEKVGEFEVTSDGRYLVACTENQSIRVFDAANGELLRTITAPIWSPMTISNNGKFVSAIWGNSQIRVWNLENGSLHSQSPVLPSGRIDRAAITDDGLHMAFSFSHGTLCLWDTRDADHVTTLTTHHDPVQAIISNSRNGLSLSLGQDGQVRAWKTETGSETYTLGFPDGLGINKLGMSHNGKLVATVASRTVYDPNSPRGNYHTDLVNLSVWDAITGQWIREFPFGEEEWLGCVGFTPDDQGLLVEHGDKVQTYDISKGTLKREAHTKISGELSPSGRYIIGSSVRSNGDLAVWNLSRDTLEFIRRAHSGFTRTFSITADEMILVSTGQEDQTAKVWEMPQGRLRNQFQMGVPTVHYGSVSPSGKFFAGGSITGDINIWKLESGEHLQSFSGYPCYIWSISWSPDEQLIFAGFSDGTIIALHNLQLSPRK